LLRIAAVLLVAAGCSKRARPELGDDGGIKPRVFKPPPSRVRAVPPHNIHAEGIGPYKLGASLGDILNLLPHGPRVELFRIGTLADYSLVRSENGALLVGVERSVGVTFVAALEPVVARTANGSEVGTARDKLLAELGPPPPAPRAVRDARLVRTAGLPEALFWIDDDKVAAVVVDSVGKRARRAVANAPGVAVDAGVGASCQPIDGALESEVLAVARLGTAATIRVLCEGAELRAAVVSWGDRWVWLAVAGVKVRRLTGGTIPGLTLAAPGVVEDTQVLLAVDESRTDDHLRVDLEVSRPVGIDKQPQSIDRTTLYQLSSDSLRLAGGTIAEAAIAVEIELGDQSLTARGLYAQRRGKGETSAIGVIAPLEPRTVELRKARRPAKPQPDAGVEPAIDAGRAIGPR
jgi:hypothetical protein